MYLESVYKFLKFPMNVIRPSNAYCPGQLLHRVIPKAIWCGPDRPQAAAARRRASAEKSYIHARDLGRAIHLVAEKAPLGRDLQRRAGEADLDPRGGRALRQRAGHAVRGVWRDGAGPAGAGFALLARFDRIKKTLGWEPQIGWDEGLAEMVDWGRRYLDEIRDWPTDYTLRG